jgi:5,5'-dehydrodivanillate O-demethylase
MINKRTNELLTQIGPGKPMGDLLRRYWHPIAAEAELDAHPIKPLRIFEEDLVLYRDLSGVYGLVERQCAHRRASLSNAVVEACGIRCTYHGWMYNQNGDCIEQPFENSCRAGTAFETRIRLKAYPVAEKAGMLWAYFGPPPAPCLMDWEYFHRRGFKVIRLAKIPCNWLQCQENAIDPVHFEWLHDNWSLRLRGDRGEYSPKHLKVRFEEFEYGFVYGRIREGGDENNPLWSVGRVCLWPNGFVTHAMTWFVPIDTYNTLSIQLHSFPIPGHREFSQQRIPFLYDLFEDIASIEALTESIRAENSSSTPVSHATVRQDVMAMVGQGVVADRSVEHLGHSDRGVIMFRNRLLGDMDLVSNGGDPKAILRDTARNVRLPLPFVEGRASHTDPVQYFGAALKPELLKEIQETWQRLAAG